jgi:hypothetical protein
MGRNAASCTTREAARLPTSTGWRTFRQEARDDLWWLPEVMRMRAAHDGDQDAIPLLRSAARLAAMHGSLALVRRCEHDLAGRDARLSGRGVLPTP